MNWFLICPAMKRAPDVEVIGQDVVSRLVANGAVELRNTCVSATLRCHGIQKGEGTLFLWSK